MLSGSWRQASGRTHGSDSYQFGDLTRSVFRTVSSINWREASGRNEGDASYQFGDISRSVLRIVPYPDLAQSQCMAGQKKFEGDISDAWKMFFAQAQACGLKALAAGDISRADIEEQAPFLFLGLPGLTFLEVALRSLNAREGTLELASGATLSRKELPDGQGSKELFQALMFAIKELKAASFDNEELVCLRSAVLCLEGNQPCSDDLERGSKINKAASMFQSMATDVSQLPFFRAHFLDVLAAILRTQAGEHDNCGAET